MVLGPAHLLQSGNSLLPIITVFRLPCVEQHIVVPRYVEVLQVLVAAGSRKNLLESAQLRQLVLVDNQVPDVIGHEIFEYFVEIILAISQMHVQRLLVPFLEAKGGSMQSVILAHLI